jgi:hypothetical protein
VEVLKQAKNIHKIWKKDTDFNNKNLENKSYIHKYIKS